MTSNIAGELNAFFQQNRVPAWGIAKAEFLETEPQGLRPSDALNGAASLICVGLPVPKGILQSPQKAEALYWRTANIYYRHIDALLVQTACMLEEHNEAAVPVFGCFPYEIRGKGHMTGNLDLVKASEAAGIGRKGKNGLLFTSKYGPRLLLGAIITTASLEPTAWPHEDRKGCPEDCSICREKCPAGAIDEAGNVNGPACTVQSTVSPIFSHLMKAGKPQAKDLQMLNHVSAVDDHSWYTCIKCVTECPHM